jgi:hypothetical protein
LKGCTNARAGHKDQQRLTPLQEEFLADWILEEDARGYPPSHVRTREMAARILRMNNNTEPLGKKWIAGFKQHNPRIVTVVGKRIEAAQIDGASPEAIRDFFDRLQRARERLNVFSENMWNMDEAGLGLGICTNTLVLASSEKSHTYVKSPQNREWVSIIETISATGQKLRCLVIFKGQSLQTTWFLVNEVPDWLYTTSENGWTSNEIGVAWLEQIFLPETKPKEGGWRILILDGHGSHISVDFLWLCK